MTNKVKFEIHSYEGVGPIRFGMAPSEVRSVLREEFKSFKRNEQDMYPCDYFTTLGCFVYYNEDERVDSVEFAEPAEPVLDGLNLLGFSFADLIRRITKMDPKVSIESDGFTSRYLGIGGWAPSAEDEPASPPESIIVFVRGYYD